MTKRMTQNDAARRFWGRHDAAQRRRDAEHERHIIARGGDCTAHVELYELVAGLARLLGWERAVEIVMRDLKSCG